MSQDPFDEELARFKQNEKPEVVLLIADDPNLIRICVAWTNTTVKRVAKVRQPRSDSESHVWNWLWKNTKFSKTELSGMSSVSEFSLDGILDPLIGNRILYPDGTLNSYVQRYLREMVLNSFGAKPKKAARKRR